MASKIIYTDKEVLIDDESIPVKNKVTADDMNEIKEVVNSHADDIETLDNQKADRTEIPTDLSELSNENTKFVNETQLANAVDYEKKARQDADSVIVNTIATISVDYGRTIELSIDSSTFILTATLKNKNGTTLSSSNIDLPIESMIVNGRYDSASKTIILTLQNGNTIEIPVGDLISGLQAEITPQNKLSSDLVDDTNHTNKFVTQAEKNQIETNKNNITSLDENKENISNKVTELTEESTDTQYPSAKVVYDNETKIKEKLDRYKNTIETELGDSTATGTDLTLNGTAEFDVDLGFSGNTSQTQYEGYNILPVPDIEETTNNGITYSASNGEMKLNGTATSNVSIALVYDLGLTTTEKITVVRNSDKPNDNQPRITTTVNGTEYNTQNQSEHIDWRTLSAGTISLVRLYIINGTVLNNVTIKPMIYLGEYDESKTYEPYVGEIPAPNPSYPQTVQVVKGNNEVKINNKNWFDNLQPGKYLDTNGNFVTTYITASSTGYIPAKENDVWIVSCQNESMGILIASFDKAKRMLDRKAIRGTVKPYTCPENTAYIVSSNAEYTNNPTQLELNSTKTDYEPHKEQIYPITLPEGMEMCKIGDYADEFIYQNSKWYKNHKINKAILDGTEGHWGKATSYQGAYYRSITYWGGLGSGNALFCNYLKYERNPANYSIGKIFNNNNYVFWFGDAIEYPTIASFTTMLANKYANGNPVIVYYISATPVLEEITDTTLITQLNNIKQAYTYQGQTNISQINEDLPFIIKADFKLSNLSRIEALENALETVSSRVDLLEE